MIKPSTFISHRVELEKWLEQHWGRVSYIGKSYDHNFHLRVRIKGWDIQWWPFSKSANGSVTIRAGRLSRGRTNVDSITKFKRLVNILIKEKKR